MADTKKELPLTIAEEPKEAEAGKEDTAAGTEVVKKKKKKKRVPKWLIFVLIIALALGGVFAYKKFFAKKEDGAVQNTATVTYGSITQVIEGEGVITMDQSDVTSLVKGEIIACYIEEGDYVEKDQVLYEIDSGDMENSITRAQNSVETAQKNYNDAVADLADLDDLNIYATAGGVITEMYVKNGDQVGKGTAICKIVDNSTMNLKIDFIKTDADLLYVGCPAEVRLTTFNGEPVYGTVSKISTGSLVNADGVSVSNVEIQVKNPGAIVPGDTATAIAGRFACAQAGTFEYNSTETVTAEQSGKIRNLSYDKADTIAKNTLIATIENEDLRKQLENAVDNSENNLENAQLNLDDLKETLDNYKIKAPQSGEIIEKNSKLGDNLDNTSGQTIMAIISNNDEIFFEMTVDELDISQIKEGQEVSVTADALEGKRFKGTVDKIGAIGTAANGVTTYTVKVVIDATTEDGFKSGMNVTGIITIDSRENVLIVPNSAIQRGNIVYVKEGSPSLTGEKPKAEASEKNMEKEETPKVYPTGQEGETPGKMPEAEIPGGEMPEGMPGEMPEGKMPQGEIPGKMPEGKRSEGMNGNPGGGMSEEMAQKALERMQENAPEGFVAVRVEVGLSDENNVEIISGLAEGDIVAVQEAKTTNNMQFGMMPGGMMGGGGMQGGGMPGGVRATGGGAAGGRGR